MTLAAGEQITLHTHFSTQKHQNLLNCLTTRLSACLSVCLSICLPVYLSAILLFYLAIILAFNLPTYLSYYLSTYRSIYRSFCLAVAVDIILSACLSLIQFQSLIYPSIHLSIYLTLKSMLELGCKYRKLYLTNTDALLSVCVCF